MVENPLKLLFGKKGELFCQHLFSYYHRFPTLFPAKLVQELKDFLPSLSPSFLETHPVNILCRILFSHYRLIKEAETRERIGVRILEINPSTYGIAIALSSLQEDEKFGEKQILKGIQNLIPGTKPLPDSYFSFRQENILLFYLEIKKLRGGIFSSEEKDKLYQELPLELRQRIEGTSRALFLPGNEEELFKNIRQLSLEIKHLDDLPQIMITFTEYVQETLKFLVIVVRVIKQKTPSLLSLSAKLPTIVNFSLESTFYVDRVQKKYPKEAAVFTLEVDGSLFLRNASAVNLRAARQYITKALESMLGTFRDYNGGLLLKENEQLSAIKRTLEKKRIYFPLLEDFFYGIKPIALRSLISIQTGIAYASLFQKITSHPLEKKCHWDSHCVEEVHLVLIKTKEKEWKNALTQRVLGHSPEFGTSALEHDGYLYLCFFHQYPAHPILLDAVQKAVNQTHSSSPKKVLHINFHVGDPPSLNPRLAHDIHTHTLSNLLFEGLMRMNCRGEVEPAAAESVKISPCRTRYTFSLRPSWWSNGEEVTAYHFERAWKKALMIHSPATLFPDFFAPIKHARKAREKRISLDRVGIDAKDAKTLFVELDAPCTYFLNLVATPPFFPLFVEPEEPITFNGPFTVADWKREQWLYLSQNPFYWNADQIKLGGIKILMIRDPYQAYRLFQQGELDIIGDPTSPLPPKILKDPRIQTQLLSKQIARVFWIHCNSRTFPLHNAHLRRALSLAISRTQLTEKVFIKQVPHATPLPPKYASIKGNIEADPEQAQACFARALKELGIERKAFPPLVMTHSDLCFEAPLIEELKTQWKEVLGISVHSKQLQWNEFSSALEKGEFQIGGLFRRDLFNDPLFYFSLLKQSPHNPHSLENVEYEKVLEAFEQGDKSKKKALESLLIEEAPVIPLINQRYHLLVNEWVKGVDWTENGCLDLKEAWLDEKVVT